MRNAISPRFAISKEVIGALLGAVEEEVTVEAADGVDERRREGCRIGRRFCARLRERIALIAIELDRGLNAVFRRRKSFGITLAIPNVGGLGSQVHLVKPETDSDLLECRR